MMKKISLMTFLAMAIFAVSINAATFNVNTTADTQDVNPGDGVCADSGGMCSLRAAITEANALAGADIINLPAGTYTQTLTGASENNNASGDWDINSDLTINGADPLTTIVQANAAPGVATERVFHIRFVVAGTVVNINGITIQNGRNAGNVFGAGVRVDNGAGTLNLENVIVQNNQNASSGGGISVSGATNATLNITNSTVSNNSAGSTTAGTSGTGGGIHINNNATVSVTNTMISNNTASSGITFGLGGGVAISGLSTMAEFTDSTISNNTAASSANSSFGGGVYAPAGTTTFTNTTISNNESNSTAGGAFSGFGGGIYNQNTTVNLQNSVVSGNSASHFHAGIRTLASTAPATTNVINSTVSNNTAPNEGGGIVNIVGASFDATTNITNSTVSGNTVSEPTSVGAGTLNFSAGTGTARTNCLNSTLSGNSSGGSGGNLHNQQSAGAAIFDINFCTIFGGIAPTGGGVNNASGQVNVKNSIIAGNTPLIGGTVTSQNYNHVQSTSGGTMTPMPNDVFGSDPQLGPLQNNGGNTMTHAPDSTSPVIDTIPGGVNDCEAPINTDQRNFSRPQSGGATLCDKGSVEFQNILVNSFAPLDFNGDGKTDYGVVRNIGASPSGATDQMRWFVNLNGTDITYAVDWGVATDKFVAADYDGDGKADIAVWRGVSSDAPSGNAFFYILESSTSTLRVEDFGIIGDNPFVVGDYDGDGKDDVAVYREGVGSGDQSYFYFRGSLDNPTGNITQVSWGLNGDIPIPGDYDGDGKADFVIRRAKTGGSTAFWMNQSAEGINVIDFGLETDRPVPGDYDGDGKTDIAVVRNNGSNLEWWINRSSDFSGFVVGWGNAATDIPAQGDYDGDGKTDISIYRAGTYWTILSSDNTFSTQGFGLLDDYPVVNRTFQY